MSATLRWGLLGTARISAKLIPAMRTARRSVVSAVASRDPARVAAFARQWEIPATHTAYDALLRSNRVDAVYIPLPNSMHVEWTLRSLDAGKHVLCEKPLAPSGDDVDRIAALAYARGRVVTEAFMYRHEPLFARVVELVREEVVGPLQSLSAGFTFVLSRHPDVRLEPALGGGSLWDIGCYSVSGVQALLRQTPIEVFGWAGQNSTGVDADFTGLLRFRDGLVATIHSSFRAAYRTWLEVAGANGVLRVSNPFKPSPREKIVLQTGDRIETIMVDTATPLYVRQIDDFVAAALDGQPPTVSLEESRGTASTLAALHRSAELQRPVQLS